MTNLLGTPKALRSSRDPRSGTICRLSRACICMERYNFSLLWWPNIIPVLSPGIRGLRTCVNFRFVQISIFAQTWTLMKWDSVQKDGFHTGQTVDCWAICAHKWAKICNLPQILLICRWPLRCVLLEVKLAAMAIVLLSHSSHRSSLRPSRLWHFHSRISSLLFLRCLPARTIHVIPLIDLQNNIFT